jgi:hypothetical protein
MRREIRIALWAVVISAVVLFAVGASVGLVVWRHTALTKPAAADAQASFTSIRERYKGRPPLVEIKNLGTLTIDVRVNRLPESAPRHQVRHFHVIVWDSRGGSFVRSSAPVWWMHFKGTSLLSQLGVPLGDLSLTVADVERYGPGIIVDFQPPGGGHMLVWTE